jgi:hypothetical protein
MTDDHQYPERGYTTQDVAALRASDPARKGFFRRHWGKLMLAIIFVVPTVAYALWTLVALTYSYSSGERVGYLQKFSKKGWICKTYEGEIAMVTLPGQIASNFQFSVRNDSLAALVNNAQGKQVALQYEQHKGLPSSCFGETEYFVKGVKVLNP